MLAMTCRCTGGPAVCIRAEPSPRQFTEGDFPSLVAKVLDSTGLAAERLEIEAEGVETMEQLAFLRTQPFDQMQGFLLAHPLPREAVPDYIGRAQAVTTAKALLTVA